MTRIFFKAAAAAMLMAATAFTACSDDKTSGIVPDGQEGDSLPGLSQEMTDRLHAIYDNASTGPQEVKTVNRLAILTSVCASREGYGPISVTPALLNGEDITLVTLGGTQDVEGQATTMKENQLASFGKPNDYLTAVTELFTDGTIPEGKPVLVTGISLGGMIAQQLLGQPQVTGRFDLKAVITFGSPITLPLDRRNVKVIRFADSHDKVPVLGEMLLRSGMVTGKDMDKEELAATLDRLDKEEKIGRTGQYTGMVETHALSYIGDSCWNGTDFMGDPDKRNVLVLQEEMTFHQAPKLSAR